MSIRIPLLSIKKEWVILIVFLLLFSCLTFLHFYSIPQESDVGCFMAIGHEIVNGSIYYSEAWDNKAPGIHFLHALFQLIFNDYLYYPAILQLVFCVFFLYTILSAVLKNSPIWTQIIVTPIALVFTYASITRHDIFFTGGFTEEIGTYLLLGTFFMYVTFLFNSVEYTKKAKLILFITGLLLGFNVLIKEPFVFTIIPFVLVILFIKNKFKWKLFLWFVLGGFFILTVFLLYLLITHTFDDYLDYIAFARNYAKSDVQLGTKFKLNLVQIIEGIWEFNHAFALLLCYSYLRVIVVFFKPKPFDLLDLFQIGLLFLTICSLPFIILGGVTYTHYFIPLLLIGLTLIITELPRTLNDTVKYQVTKYFKAALLSFIVFKSLRAKLDFQLKENEILNENRIISRTYLLNSNCFIDDQSSGRFYFYLNCRSGIKIPVPFYNYFSGNKENKQAIKNQVEFRTQFINTPPQFMITKKNPSVAFQEYNIGTFVTMHYQAIDSFIVKKETFFVKKFTGR